MRFRYKVLISNIIILSFTVGMVGFLMIDRNFKLAMETQLKNAVLQNNLIQSSVEYELLDIINSNVNLIPTSLKRIGTQVYNELMTQDTSIYIRYNDKIVYTSDNGTLPSNLFEETIIGRKNYLILQEEQQYMLYVTSINRIQENLLYVVTKIDITEAYTMMREEVTYFKFLLVGILLVCSVFLYLISYLLTKPLEKLNAVTDRFAKGDYSVHSDIRQSDEVGQLSLKFNDMADAVSGHINELNNMVKQREQFVADFTHELKTPMTSIIGYADMLRSKEMNRERQIMAAGYIFSEGKRLEVMSRKLFDLIYLGQHEIELSDISVAKLAEDIFLSTEPMLAAKNITLHKEIEPAVIKGDKELLRTAFVNLIDNARKASEPESEILLTGSRKEDTYTLSVTDHGIGMTEEDAKRICDEFYMVNKSRAREEGGAGLGMSLVAIIVKRHHATMDIRSKPGEGTCILITFTLPETDDTQNDTANRQTHTENTQNDADNKENDA